MSDFCHELALQLCGGLLPQGGDRRPAELTANAKPFANVKHNITSRRKTAASVKWSPEPWSVGDERSEKQRTPDLSSLIQEVVNQPDWKKGNALVFIISGPGRRNAQSWDGGWSGDPMLYVEH